MAGPAVLVVGPTTRVEHEGVVRAIAQHWPLVFLDHAERPWRAQYTQDSMIADLADPAEVLAAGQALGARTAINSLVTMSALGMPAAAALAELLGLPGPTADTVAASLDRSIARSLLSDAGLPVPATIRVGSLHEAAAAALRIGYPVTVRPVAQTGYAGATRVDAPDALPTAFQAATSASTTVPDVEAVLVEPYLDGAELNVQCITTNGHTHIVAAARTTFGRLPHLLPASHLVTWDDPAHRDLADLARQATAAIGVDHGASHLQIRMTPTGPYVVDIAAHLAADRIPEIVHLATGVDLAFASVIAASGQRPDLQRTRANSASVGFIHEPNDGLISGQTIDPELRHSPWFEDVQWHQDLGELIYESHTTRIADYTVTGPDAATCLGHLHAARAGIRTVVATRQTPPPPAIQASA